MQPTRKVSIRDTTTDMVGLSSARFQCADENEHPVNDEKNGCQLVVVEEVAQHDKRVLRHAQPKLCSVDNEPWIKNTQKTLLPAIVHYSRHEHDNTESLHTTRRLNYTISHCRYETIGTKA